MVTAGALMGVREADGAVSTGGCPLRAGVRVALVGVRPAHQAAVVGDVATEMGWHDGQE